MFGRASSQSRLKSNLKCWLQNNWQADRRSLWSVGMPCNLKRLRQGLERRSTELCSFAVRVAVNVWNFVEHKESFRFIIWLGCWLYPWMMKGWCFYFNTSSVPRFLQVYWSEDDGALAVVHAKAGSTAISPSLRKLALWQTHLEVLIGVIVDSMEWHFNERIWKMQQSKTAISYCSY